MPEEFGHNHDSQDCICSLPPWTLVSLTYHSFQEYIKGKPAAAGCSSLAPPAPISIPSDATASSPTTDDVPALHVTHAAAEPTAVSSDFTQGNAWCVRRVEKVGESEAALFKLLPIPDNLQATLCSEQRCT